MSAPKPVARTLRARTSGNRSLRYISANSSVAVRSASVSDVADGTSVACQPSVDDSR